ncbi:MAG: hypothetical protein ABIJ96_09585 [Elusimicrobiota bacterium]
MRSKIILLWGVAALLACPVSAEPSRLIRFQGRLMDAVGSPIVQTQSVLFSFYSAPTGGGAAWSETQTVSPDTSGRYEILLGQATPFPAALPFDQDYWLGINVANDGEMTPRLRLTVGPYAIHASSARYVPDSGISGSTWTALTDGSATTLHGHAGPALGAHAAVHAAGAAETLTPHQVDVSSLAAGYSVLLATSSGRVGIGTSEPALLLDVAGAAQFGSGAIKSTITSTGDLIVGSTFTSGGDIYLGDSTSDIFIFNGYFQIPAAVIPAIMVTPTGTGELVYGLMHNSICVSTGTTPSTWVRGDDNSTPCPLP